MMSGMSRFKAGRLLLRGITELTSHNWTAYDK